MNALVTTNGPGSPAAVNEVMQKLMDRAKTAIQSAFLDSLTDEQYQQMVQQTVDDFRLGPLTSRFSTTTKREHFYDKPTLGPNDKLDREWSGPGIYQVTSTFLNQSYNPANDKTTLPGMLKEELLVHARDKIKNWTESPQFRQSWNSNSSGYSEENMNAFMEKFLAENAGAIIAGAFGQMFSMATQQVLSNLRR